MKKMFIQILLISIVLYWLWSQGRVNAETKIFNSSWEHNIDTTLLNKRKKLDKELYCKSINKKMSNYINYKIKIDNLFLKISQMNDNNKHKYYNKIWILTKKYLKKIDHVNQTNLYIIVSYLKCENDNKSYYIEYYDSDSKISFSYNNLWWQPKIESYSSVILNTSELNKNIKSYKIFFKKIGIIIYMTHNNFKSELSWNDYILAEEKKNYKNIWWKNTEDHYFKWVDLYWLQKMNTNLILTTTMWGIPASDDSSHHIKKVYYKDVTNKKYSFIKINWTIHNTAKEHLSYLNEKTIRLLNSMDREHKKSIKLITLIVKEIVNLKGDNSKYVSEKYYSELQKVNHFVESIKIQ